MLHEFVIKLHFPKKNKITLDIGLLSSTPALVIFPNFRKRFVLIRSVNNAFNSNMSKISDVIAKLLVQQPRLSSHTRTQTQTAFGPNKGGRLYHVGSNTRVFLRVAASRSFLSAAVKGLISPQRRFYFPHIVRGKAAPLSPVHTHTQKSDFLRFFFPSHLPLLPIFDVTVTSCCTIRAVAALFKHHHQGTSGGSV